MPPAALDASGLTGRIPTSTKSETMTATERKAETLLTHRDGKYTYVYTARPMVDDDRYHLTCSADGESWEEGIGSLPALITQMARMVLYQEGNIAGVLEDPRVTAAREKILAIQEADRIHREKAEEQRIQEEKEYQEELESIREAASKLKTKRQDIRPYYPDFPGPEAVPAYAFGGLAHHKSIGDNSTGWSLTHVGSGKAIITGTTKAKARAMHADLVGRIDWTVEDISRAMQDKIAPRYFKLKKILH